ncbi:type II toxin-antitoxin system PemK/MazF family toxin [Pseudostreptobacillus sp.]
MIGKICIAIFPFYDIKLKKNLYKQRPVLIIGEAINNDYTILPVSTITKKENIDIYYDIAIDPEKYPKLNLDKYSYIRTHKQTVIYKDMIKGEISDLKEEYLEIYSDILNKLKEFNIKLIEKANGG